MARIFIFKLHGKYNDNIIFCLIRILSERRFYDKIPPFDSKSSRDRLWQKIDLKKTVSDTVFKFGIMTLLNQGSTALTHQTGIQLRGFAQMTLKVPQKSDDNVGSWILSQQEFFKEGKKYPVMVRFSNFGSKGDDRDLNIRGAAVKFSEHPVS